MSEQASFGYWMRRRRKALDLTQAVLARRVGCAEVTIQKIEADERRPSRPFAERLAEQLAIPLEARAAFLHCARAELSAERLASPLEGVPSAAVAFTAPTNPTPGHITPPVTAPHPSPLPHPATPFIGRASELAETSALFDDPACRLVTLTGPGGIGKTRLALALAAARAGHYPHGVRFVDLTSLSADDGVVSAIADTFKLSGLGVGDPMAALRNYLREKSLLLVLDNFEHVLDAADLVGELLAIAPGVQVLATSRERLHLCAERVYDVGGLPFPLEAAHPNAATFDAVRMFVASVRHTHPQYQVGATDMPVIAQICRLAAGMPLGIELAAAWVPTLPLTTIAAELTTGLDLLETTLRDVPQRHRSARAVFEHSWKLLTVEEQTVFRQLAVFRGGFTLAAAQQVAGATRGTLARLVDTSLLRPGRDGRYDLHELLRQFAAEKLHAEPGVEERTLTRHSTFYLALLQRKEPELKGALQLAALDELERAFENVRGAWDWSLQCGQWERLRTCLAALCFFMTVRARYLELVALLQRVVDTAAAAENSREETTQRQGLAAFARTLQSFYFVSIGQFGNQVSGLERSRAAVHQYGTPYEIATHCHMDASSCTDMEEARALYEQALAMLRAIGATWDVGFVLNDMGRFAFRHGRAREAKRHLEEALTVFRTCGEGELVGRASALVELGWVAYALGDYEEGRQLLEESLTSIHRLGFQIAVADRQEALSELAYAQGQFGEAEVHVRQELAILRDLGYRERLSWGLSRCGAAVLAQERLSEAAELLAEALAIAEGCDDERGIARAHKELGELALKQGSPDMARRHWRTAIELAWRVQDRPHLLVTLDALTGLATLMTQAGDVERAAEVLTLVHGAARIDRHTETRTKRLLADLEGRLAPARFTVAQARGRVLGLGATMAAMLADDAA